MHESRLLILVNLLLEDLNGSTLYLLYECSFCCFDFLRLNLGVPQKIINFGRCVILGWSPPLMKFRTPWLSGICLGLVRTPDLSSDPNHIRKFEHTGIQSDSAFLFGQCPKFKSFFYCGLSLLFGYSNKWLLPNIISFIYCQLFWAFNAKLGGGGGQCHPTLINTNIV